MTEIISVDDLPSDIAENAMSEVWVEGANARASRVAPCLAATDPAPTLDQVAEAKLILLGAVMRWSQAGAGALQSQRQEAGEFSLETTFDTRQRTGFNLWPSEIKQLQDICKTGGKPKAFSVDAVRQQIPHSPVCSVYFGGECSCGAAIAWQAIYEQQW